MRETMDPLFVHASLDEPLAYHAGRCITAGQYLAAVKQLSEDLPASQHVLIACQDRLAFAVGFGAALMRSQVCMLPATHTPELIAQLQSQYPDLYVMSDADTSIDLPPLRVDALALSDASDQGLTLADVPHFASEQIAAMVFTSGSTGLPVPHRKTWGKLVINVRSEGARLDVMPDRRVTMIGTVPPQHMYGFESTVLIALQNAAAFESGKPFYPADIVQAVRSVPQPRVLITTPFHLRALVSEMRDADETLGLERMVSATAPLSAQLALEAEQTLGAPLYEIYGSTETSQLATRQTTQTQAWTVFDGIVLIEQAIEGQTRACATGAQIEGTVPINDVLTLQSPQVFTLHGRTAEMVNIAGKSTSLGFLNSQLLAIEGVKDGCFLIPETRDEGVGNTTRLAALVVAPGLDSAQLLQSLRQRIAPAFMPRPLKLVDSLPRNSTGKLPREALLALLNSAVHRL
jgi:acyl-coenzyme A synthetase/AMP-(fatty) acid ligase